MQASGVQRIRVSAWTSEMVSALPLSASLSPISPFVCILIIIIMVTSSAVVPAEIAFDNDM